MRTQPAQRPAASGSEARQQTQQDQQWGRAPLCENCGEWGHNWWKCSAHTGTPLLPALVARLAAKGGGKDGGKPGGKDKNRKGDGKDGGKKGSKSKDAQPNGKGKRNRNGAVRGVQPDVDLD